MHEFKDGTVQKKSYFIEFYDIGGNISHRKSAKMFYNNLDGIILVHDLTNRKSEENLKYWLTDVLEENESMSISTSDVHSSPTKNANYYNMSSANMMPPLLVIGTKSDQAQLVRNSLRTCTSYVAAKYRADEINLDCMEPKYLAPATTNSIKLAKFFDKAIEYKLSQHTRMDNLRTLDTLNKNSLYQSKFK